MEQEVQWYTNRSQRQNNRRNCTRPRRFNLLDKKELTECELELNVKKIECLCIEGRAPDINLEHCKRNSTLCNRKAIPLLPYL